MNTVLLVLCCLFIGYIAGSMVERFLVRKVKNNNKLTNPPFGESNHMTGDLEKSGMTSNKIEKYG